MAPKSSTQLEMTWEAPTLAHWNSEHLSYKVGYKYVIMPLIRVFEFSKITWTKKITTVEVNKRSLSMVTNYPAHRFAPFDCA